MQSQNLNTNKVIQVEGRLSLTSREKDVYIEALEEELDVAAKEILRLSAAAHAGNTLGLAIAKLKHS